MVTLSNDMSKNELSSCELVSVSANDGVFYSLKGTITSEAMVTSVNVSIGDGKAYEATIKNREEVDSSHWTNWSLLVSETYGIVHDVNISYQTIHGEEYFNSVKPESHPDERIHRDIRNLCSEVGVATSSVRDLVISDSQRFPKKNLFRNYQDVACPELNEDVSNLKICIVASDLIGPIKNGGIGTFNYNLACWLSQNGAEVTILWAHGNWVEVEDVYFWRKHFKKFGMEFVTIESTANTYLASHTRLRSLRVRDWLLDKSFDYIYFSDMHGCAYDSALSKTYGDNFKDSKLIVVTHSSTKWHRHFNNQFLDIETDIEFDFLEKHSTALADLVISPSRYLLEWYKQDEWRLPQNTIILPYPFINNQNKIRTDLKTKYKEICFFGRLETRKGLELFCDTIDNIGNELYNIDIVFLGKETYLNGITSREYIQKRSKKWTSKVHIISNYSQKQALEYLSKGDVLAVLPSISDNSPFTVYECLNHGIPFIAARTGGIPELIKNDYDLFEVSVSSLANCLRQKIQSKPEASYPRYENSEVLKLWLALHNDKTLWYEKETIKNLDNEVKVLKIVVTRNLYSNVASQNLNGSDNDNILYFDSTRRLLCSQSKKPINLENFVALVEKNLYNRVLIVDENVTLYYDAQKHLENTFLKSDSAFVVTSIDVVTKQGTQDNIRFTIPAAHDLPEKSIEDAYLKTYCIYAGPNTLNESLYATFVTSDFDPFVSLLRMRQEKSAKWAPMQQQVGYYNADISSQELQLRNVELEKNCLSTSNNNITTLFNILKNKSRELFVIHNPKLTNKTYDSISAFYNSKNVLKEYSRGDFKDVMLIGGGTLLKNHEEYLAISFSQQFASCIVDLYPQIHHRRVAIFIETWFSYGGDIYFGFNDTSREVRKVTDHSCQIGINHNYFITDVEPYKPLIVQLSSKKDEIAQIRRIEVRGIE